MKEYENIYVDILSRRAENQKEEFNQVKCNKYNQKNRKD